MSVDCIGACIFYARKKSTVHNRLLKKIFESTVAPHMYNPINNNKHLILKVCIFILKLDSHEQTPLIIF